MGFWSTSPPVEPADAGDAGGSGAASPPTSTPSGTTPPGASFLPPPSAAATVEESAKKGLDSSYTPGSIVNKYTASKKTDYDTANLGQWTSQVHDSDGLDDAKYLEQQRYAQRYGSQSWFSQLQASMPPRMRGCVNSITMGCKMGAAVGGVFGTIMGCYASVVHRNVLLLPVAAIGGACSFGFFLGCGMIIRCEETGKFASPAALAPKQFHHAGPRVNTSNTFGGSGLVMRRGVAPTVVAA